MIYSIAYSSEIVVYIATILCILLFFYITKLSRDDSLIDIKKSLIYTVTSIVVLIFCFIFVSISIISPVEITVREYSLVKRIQNDEINKNNKELQDYIIETLSDSKINRYELSKIEYLASKIKEKEQEIFIKTVKINKDNALNQIKNSILEKEK